MPSLNQNCLINGDWLDAVPACLYSAKANQHARKLAQSDWLIREKQNGRYVAVVANQSIQFLRRSANDCSRAQAISRLFADGLLAGRSRPTGEAQTLLDSLAIDAENYSTEHHLALMAEPYTLEYAGRDRYQRVLWLENNSGAAWRRMQKAARKDALFLEAISGFRSIHYQMGIFQRKLARGQTVADILKVNAAPGFSEHHSGRAIDISAVGEPAAEQSFDQTAAFGWLNEFAGDFGFRLSYPRHNIHGISYEPWHWYYLGND